MHWKLSVGKSAKVTQLIDSLHAIELHWLAGKVLFCYNTFITLLVLNSAHRQISLYLK